MAYVAIMSWTQDNRVAKMMDFATQGEAESHVSTFAGTYPSAFVTQSLAAPLTHWLVDPQAQTVSVSVPFGTVAQIVTERERRMALGFDYDFGDARGVHRIGTTPADMVGWRDVIDYANALIDSGDTSTQINIMTDTGPTAVTAPEWQAIMLAAAAIRQNLWAKSFALQAMSPIPGDYANDNYWTA